MYNLCTKLLVGLFSSFLYTCHTHHSACTHFSGNLKWIWLGPLHTIICTYLHMWYWWLQSYSQQLAVHSLSLFRLTTSNITYFQLSQDGRHNGKNLPFFCSPIMLVSFGVTNMRSRNKATCWGGPTCIHKGTHSAGVTQHVSIRVLTLLGWPNMYPQGYLGWPICIHKGTHSLCWGGLIEMLPGCVPHRLRWHSFGWVVRCKRCHHTPGLYCTLTVLLSGS